MKDTLINRLIVYLTFFIFVVSSIAFADISPRFGIKNSFNYIDLKENEYLGDSIFSNDTYIYLGFEYLDNNFYFSFKPAIKIYTKDNTEFIYDNGSIIKQNDNKAYASFTFDEIQFNYINEILGFYIGKRKFHFGEGFNRQYIFVGESVLYNDYESLYNTELNFYQGNITHSIGFITDTKSIDLLKEPNYYTSWYYLKYSSSHLGLMGITKYTYDLQKKNNLMLGFETSYIFDIGFKLYGNVTYNILSSNDIGKSLNDIKSLLGINYTFIYNYNLILSPYVEYFYEDSHSFYSVGLYLSFLNNLFNIITYFSHSPGYKMDLDTKLLINYNNFNFTFNYYTPFNNDEILEHTFEISLEYNY
ncbi:hypothetical protein SZ50_11300 [Brachyspira hyodysenteriae]|uniref:hypothetical protein n=1 Tax=Brachyspira hyodysenteriae TaxID=159 RepID=UPI00063DB10E|nr:hypothetical protein [Brachyspira hyodysenteriae]KLI31282.1 hypothetical protein SZ50_11300 [Brachyspira hyodysenteriae]